MNMFLHGIGGDDSPIIVGDSLAADPGDRFDMVLTNPPFGKKSSITIMNEEGKADKETLTYERQDFWATTSNKQLNFLQHVKTLLKINGKAAVGGQARAEAEVAAALDEDSLRLLSDSDGVWQRGRSCGARTSGVVCLFIERCTRHHKTIYWWLHHLIVRRRQLPHLGSNTKSA